MTGGGGSILADRGSPLVPRCTHSIGHNPTGIVLGLARRRDIYATCSKYDVVIVEDDPYWFLQFPSAAAQEAASRNQAPPPPPESAPEPPPRRPSSGYGFLDSLTPSFLSIDVDGRVVRLDTFSKMAAPGCRLGWVTAQPALVERYVRIAEATTQQPSGFVQSLVASLVLGNDRPAAAAALSAFAALRTPRERAAFAGWHTVGWVRWLEGLRGAYEARMARLCRVLDAGAFQLKQGTPALPRDADWGVVTKTRLVHFRWPRGGMFVWLRVNFEAHPLWRAAAPRRELRGRRARPVHGPAHLPDHPALPGAGQPRLHVRRHRRNPPRRRLGLLPPVFRRRDGRRSRRLRPPLRRRPAPLLEDQEAGRDPRPAGSGAQGVQRPREPNGRRLCLAWLLSLL